MKLNGKPLSKSSFNELRQSAGVDINDELDNWQ